MAKSIRDLIALDSDESEKPRKAASLVTLDQEDETPTAAAAPVSDGLPADFPRHEEDESTGEWWKKELKALTYPETWKRPLQLAARTAIDTVESLPMTAADMGVSARNMLTGSDYEMPSQMNRQSLNTVLPEPETVPEKAASFIGGAVAGARLPAPQAAKQAPVGFVVHETSPLAPILKEAQDAGYVVPPATASGSKVAKVVESVAGKTATAQAASIKNQKVTNDLARQALGMEAGEQITPTKLAAIRETAGKVYEKIAGAGDIVADAKYIDDLAQLGKSADEIAQAFPGANVGATKQIDELVSSLLQDKFDSRAALQYLRELRKMASGNLSGINAADPAKQALGMAQREAAATLEDLIGRTLETKGMGDIAAQFADARKTIAITHTVENALNETTGNVLAGKLGQQLAKGKPLSGQLEIAAKFARAFPKASKEVTESMPGISPLDWMAAGGIGAISGSPLAALLPPARIATREAAVSNWAQQLLSAPPKPYAGAPATLGLAPGAVLQLEAQQ